MLPLLAFVPFSKLQPAAKTSQTLSLSDPWALRSTLALHEQCNTVPAITAISDPRQPLGRGPLNKAWAAQIKDSRQQTGHGIWKLDEPWPPFTALKRPALATRHFFSRASPLQARRWSWDPPSALCGADLHWKALATSRAASASASVRLPSMNLPSRKALQVFAFGKILSARKCFALHSALQDVAALGQWPWTQDPQLSFALLVTSEISFHVDVFWVGSTCSARPHPPPGPSSWPEVFTAWA